MSESKLKAYAEEAAPVIESVLANLVQKDLSIEAGTIEESTRESVLQRATSHFTAVSTSEHTSSFALQLTPEWIPLISAAMLGNPMTAEDPGVVDLTSQITSQGLKAWREQTETGANIPDVGFEAFSPGEEIPEAALEESLWSLSFHVEVEGESYEGMLIIADAAFSTAGSPDETLEAEAPQPTEDSVDVSRISFPEFGRETVQDGHAKNFDLLAEVELNITVELGRRRLPLSEVLLLTTGSVIELEKLVGEPLEIFANGRLIAEGEAVVVDEQFGVRITNLASTKQRVKAFA